MTYEPLADFIVHMCAIIGGIFAAASIFESILHQGFCMVAPIPKEVLEAQKRAVHRTADDDDSKPGVEM